MRRMFLAGFDEQPLSVSVVGVAQDGHTTYAVAGGQATGTFEEGGFAHTTSKLTKPALSRTTS